ncbi:hypothetical protein Tco_0305954, partial [Tanacetum coccineum]
MDSPEVNDSSDIWKNQHTWSIQSWKLYSFSGVHVLETSAERAHRLSVVLGLITREAVGVQSYFCSYQ